MKHVLPPAYCPNCNQPLPPRKTAWCNGVCKQQWRAKQRRKEPRK